MPAVHLKACPKARRSVFLTFRKEDLNGRLNNFDCLGTNLKLEFENLYLTPKEGYDSTWQPILDPAGLSMEILGLRYEYDENVLLYPSESRDLYIDLFNNYEMWVDEKGATIKISIVGDNSKLKTQSFKVKLEG